MKRAIRWAAIFVAVLLLAAVTLPFWINANQFRPMLESSLTSALGREVKLGELKLAVLSGSVTTNDLSVADDPLFNRTPFVRAKSLHLAIELWPLIFSRKLIVTGLTIEQPAIMLLQSPAGDWNFSKLGAQPAAKLEGSKSVEGKGGLDLAVKLVKITDGQFTMGKTEGHLKPLVLEKLNGELRDFSSTSVFPFSLSANVAGGGTLRLEGKAGPLDQEDVSGTPLDAALKITQLDLAGSGLTEALPGIAALISLDGHAASKGEGVLLQGKVKLEKLKLAATGTPAHDAVELDFEIQHNLRKHAGVVRRAEIHIGKALATLTGSYASPGDSTVLKMSLSGPGMPLPDLAAMLPAMGIVLPAGSSFQGGTATAKFALDGPANQLVTDGSLVFSNTRLAGFDMGKKMAAVEMLAGVKAAPNTEIQTLSANLRMAPEGIRAEAIKLVVPAIGELGGGGTVSKANALDFQMTAAVHTAGMLAAVNDRPIPFLIGGTASDPVFRPDVRAVARQEVDRLKGDAAKSAGGFLKGLLGGKKK